MGFNIDRLLCKSCPALLLLTISNYAKQNVLLLFYLVCVTQISDVLTVRLWQTVRKDLDCAGD